MGRIITAGATNTTVTSISIALGATATVMPGSSQFQQVGAVLARAVYAALAIAYPGQTMYSNLANTGSNLAGANQAPTRFIQIVFGLGVYLGVTDTGAVYSSASPVTGWTLVAGITATSIAFSGTTFVAFPFSAIGVCYTSTNGTVWTTIVGQITAGTIYKVAYANGMFVALCSGGTVQYPTYSAAGAVWTLGATTPPNQLLSPVAAGLNVVGLPLSTTVASQYTSYSSIGSTWTNSVTLPVIAIWSAAAANAAGSIVVIAYNSNVAAYTSNSGSSYIATTMPVSAYWSSVSWNAGAGLFVAIGNTASAGGPGATTVIATSPTGAVWTLVPVTTNLYGLYYSNSANGYLWLTPNWTTGQLLLSPTPPTASTYTTYSYFFPNCGGAAFNPVTGTFVQITGIGGNAGAYAQNPIAGVTNTLTWSTSSLPAIANWMGCACGGGIFAAIASGGTTAAYSTNDGGSWLAAVLPSVAPWSAITYGANFVAVAGWNAASTAAAYSANGSAWTAAVMPSSQRWVDVAAGNGTVVAISGGNDYVSNVAAYSTNGGATWTQAVLPASLYWTKITFGNGLFVATATTGLNGYTGGSTSGFINYATSPDGLTWTLRSFPATPSSSYMTFGNGMFLTAGYTSVDAINWVTRAGGPSLPAAYGAGLFVASGQQYFVDNAATSQYVCLTGTPGTTLRVQ